jgi:hypothetical protein
MISGAPENKACVNLIRYSLVNLLCRRFISPAINSDMRTLTSSAAKKHMGRVHLSTLAIVLRNQYQSVKNQCTVLVTEEVPVHLGPE